jgi:hypothetical protein
MACIRDVPGLNLGCDKNYQRFSELFLSSSRQISCVPVIRSPPIPYASFPLHLPPSHLDTDRVVRYTINREILPQFITFNTRTPYYEAVQSNLAHQMA